MPDTPNKGPRTTLGGCEAPSPLPEANFQFDGGGSGAARSIDRARTALKETFAEHIKLDLIKEALAQGGAA